MSSAASGTDTADPATKDAASPAPEGALHRVMNHLLTSSRSAKDKLDRVHQENLTWIFNAVYDAKNRVAGKPIERSKQRKHANLDAEAPKAATEGAPCAEGLQRDVTMAQHEAMEATQLQQQEQPEAVRVHLTRKRKHAATDCNPVSNQATASVGAPQAKKRLVPSEMRVADLRPELRKRGLPSGGRKVELVARLEQALAQEDVAGEIEKDLEEIREEDEMEVEEEAGEHLPQNNREPLELRKPHATNALAAAPTPGTQVVVKGDAKGHAGGKHEDFMMKQDAPESSEAQAPAADSTTIERPQSVVTEGPSASLKRSRSRGQEGEKPAPASPVAVNGDPTALKSPVGAKGDEVAPASTPGANTSRPASAEPDRAPDDAQHASGAPLEEHEASSKGSDVTTVKTALDGPNDGATAVAPAAEGVSPSTTATAGVAVASKSSGVNSQAATEPAAPASSTTMPEASIAVSRVPVAASEVELGPEAEPPAAGPAMSYLDRLRLASLKQEQGSATTTASTTTEGAKPAPARLRRGSIVGPGLAAPSAPIRSAAPVSAPAVTTNSGATNHSSSFSSSSSQSAPPESTSSSSTTTTAAKARAGPTTTVAPARAVSPPDADTSKTAAPAPSSASTAAAASVNKPTNLLGGLHSFTSLLKGSKPEQNSKQPVKIKALERAEEKRRLDQAKEDERRQRKAMLEHKKADATRMQEEAEKKRAAIAAKRKEREEQKGNAGKQANNDASAKAPEEKRPRLEQAPKKPEDAKSRPAPSRPEDAVKKIAPDQETMPKSAQSSAARAAPPNHATSSNGPSPSSTRQAGAARVGAPVLNKTTTTAPAASSHKPALALKDISNTANHTAANVQKSAADIVKPSAHMTSMSGKLAVAAASSHASAPQDNYEISDREDSSDDDCESDDGRKEAKRVPEWAKGPALKEAVERQLNQQTRVDPDALFSEQIKTCNLDAIFSSFNAQAKKSRNYRTRQSTGNWKRDELTSAEKTRYRREMGF